MKYAVKIWLFSVLVAPILLIAFLQYENGGINLERTFETYVLSVAFGGLFSIPSVLIFTGTIYGIIGIGKDKMLQKGMIQTAAVFLCILPIIFFFDGIGDPKLPVNVIIIYLSTLSFGIWFFDYKLHLLEEELAE